MMQITIDDDTFHKWATERGYVLASEVIPKIRAAFGLDVLTTMQESFQKFPTPAGVQYAAVATTFTDEVAALEQPEDLKPAEPPLTDRQTIRLLGELFEHYGNSPEANKACRALLDRYGAAKASEIPPEDRAELARLVNSRHDYATADEFIASLKP
jgi:hypothetical protein